MAEWIAPKDIIEIDDDDKYVSELHFHHQIGIQLELCKNVFQHLHSNYKRLYMLEYRRRDARCRESRERWQERKRLIKEEQKEVASRMCFVCRQKFEKVNKVEEKREISRSRSRSRRVSMSAASR